MKADVCVYVLYTNRCNIFHDPQACISSFPVCVLDVMVVREASDLLKHTRVFESTVQFHPGPNRPVYLFPLGNVMTPAPVSLKKLCHFCATED